MDERVRTSRVRAPELYGAGGWINSEPLTLAGLRGRIVLLDFWTFCCVNCLHVIDELREIERAYADVLVTIGVHSPKFVHEADHEALVAAVERYEVDHPVLDDPGLVTWNQYAVRAWPTLAVVDPEGYVVAQMSGEGHGHGLAALLDELIEEHTAKGTLVRGASYLSVPVAGVLFRAALPGQGRGAAVRRPAGGRRPQPLARGGLAARFDHRRTTDRQRSAWQCRWSAAEAEFAEPQGVLVLPADVSAAVGYDVVVADTANHLLRGVVLATGAVTTVAGTGRQWMRGSATSGDALSVDLSTPWDLAWYGDQVVVAMAGTHQLWSFDPLAGRASVLAGTTNEGLRDGPAAEAWMAQPSGLVADGEPLWIADSETSALRVLRGGSLHTVVGQGLFAFGHRDGVASDACLQHPLGVALLPDGSIAICDTYNNAVRRYDPITDEVSTLAVGVSEPSGAVVVNGQLVVVESAAHRLSTPVAEGVLPHDRRETHRAAAGDRPRAGSGPARGGLRAAARPAPRRAGRARHPADRECFTPDLLLVGEGASTGLTRTLQLAEGEGVLHIAAMGASCDVDVEFAACHVHQQDWGIPVRVVVGAPSTLTLMLRG